MHAVTVVLPSGGREHVVLRRYVRPEINQEEPDLADREQRALRLAQTLSVPTPTLLGCDPTGAEVGVPAVAMSLLPGRLEWFPPYPDRWLRGLAEVLPAIHTAPLPAGHGIGLLQPYPPERDDPPAWMRQPRLWQRALEIFHGPPLDRERPFIHRDYYAGNVLWRRGRVTGVVDWQVASIGSPSIDAGWCRLNLLRRFGVEVATRFTAMWEEASGASYHPWAEVVLLMACWAAPMIARPRMARS